MEYAGARTRVTSWFSAPRHGGSRYSGPGSANTTRAHVQEEFQGLWEGERDIPLDCGNTTRADVREVQLDLGEGCTSVLLVHPRHNACRCFRVGATGMHSSRGSRRSSKKGGGVSRLQGVDPLLDPLEVMRNLVHRRLHETTEGPGPLTGIQRDTHTRTHAHTRTHVYAHVHMSTGRQ